MELPSINVCDLDNLTKDNVIIIDVRDSEKFEAGHITGAINIHKSLLIGKVFDVIDTSNNYVIYCGAGNSSQIVTKVMIDSGYKALNLNGGYASYSASKKAK